MPLWNENAVAVRSIQNDRIILCEGSLSQVVATLRTCTAAMREDVRVSLPDRRTAPRTFEGRGLEALLVDPWRPVVDPVSLKMPRM